MTERMEEKLRLVLSYIASEALKARKMRKMDRAEKLVIAFKILSEEYEEVKRQGEASEGSRRFSR